MSDREPFKNSISSGAPTMSQSTSSSVWSHDRWQCINFLFVSDKPFAHERLGGLLQCIFRFARFRPAASHPHFACWLQ
jgi:hypothetical protein